MMIKQMFKKIFLLTCALALSTMSMPWFTFNVKLTGYYWGIQVFPYIFIQIIYMVIYVKKDLQGLLFDFLWEASLLSIPAIYIYVFFTWPIQFLITSEISLKISRQTATPFFNLSLFFVCLLAIVGTIYLIRKKRGLNS